MRLVVWVVLPLLGHPGQNPTTLTFELDDMSMEILSHVKRSIWP